LNQVSAGIKHAVSKGLIKPNHVAADVGGGKFDKGKEHVESNVHGSKMHVYDPYNRSEEHNKQVDEHTVGKSDYVGCHNVLNVIKEKEARSNVLENVKKRMKHGTGIAHITTYEGDKSGEGRVTKKSKTGETSWQNNKPTKHYLPEIKEHFPEDKYHVEHKSGHILISHK
jgi:hypothetical protein